MSVTSPMARRTGFVTLQHEKLPAAWAADRPGSRTPHVLVALPSFALDRTVYDHYGDRVPPLENRYLYVLLRAMEAATGVVFLSSLPVPADSLDCYLSLTGPSARSQVLARSRLVSADDPSWRPLAEKLLDRGDIVDEVRRYVGGRPAILEPWNIGPAEEELSVALGIPANATGTSRSHLATKSNGRRLLRAAGVAVPEGYEDVTTPAEVVAAIRRVARLRPQIRKVVVKLDDSVAGDGNVTVPVSTVAELDDVRAAEAVGRLLPPWYVDVLRRGGVVEQLVTGVEVRSPSAQAAIAPDGAITVLATHEQRLGGANGQVFEGATSPASSDYATELGQKAHDVGVELARNGAVGRFSVDFVVSRRSAAEGWNVYGLEINLRKGGTTHTRPHAPPARRPVRRRAWPAHRRPGAPACYAATDNLVRPAWVGRSPLEVRQRLTVAHVDYDHEAGTGVVAHMLDCLRVDGRMGYTALAGDPEAVAQLESRVVTALS